VPEFSPALASRARSRQTIYHDVEGSVEVTRLRFPVSLWTFRERRDASRQFIAEFDTDAVL
jgi:hypothetical protein